MCDTNMSTLTSDSFIMLTHHRERVLVFNDFWSFTDLVTIVCHHNFEWLLLVLYTALSELQHNSLSLCAWSSSGINRLPGRVVFNFSRVNKMALSLNTFKQSKLRHLTHFCPMFYVNTPWKHQKTKGFLMFSGVMEMEHWVKTG